MESSIHIGLDFVVEAVRSPLLREEWNRHDLTKAVNHKSAAAHCVDDGCVVDHLNFDFLLHAPEIQISVRGGAERISHNQETNTLSFGLFDHLLTTRFDEFTISDNHVLTVVF